MNRWILEMREYSYKIQYIKGIYNNVADQLSRPVLLIPPPPADTILGKTKEEIRTLQLEEGRWVQMIEYLEGGNVPRRNFPRSTLNQFVVWERVLYYTITKKDGNEQFCLVVPTALKQQALEQTHAQMGHLGIEKTLTKVQGLYYWQNMKVDVIMNVRNCLTCQQYKGTTGLQ